jgi:hypothetical protein
LRLVGKLKLGYYPLPISEGEKIKKLLAFGPDATSVVDPCVGDGAALLQLTEAAGTCRRHGIELDSARAAAANAAGITTVQGSAFDTYSRVERFSFLYLNPPYDSEIGSFGNRRMEELFLDHTAHWLAFGGILVFVIPRQRLEPCADILAHDFKDIQVFKMTDPESVRFDQIVVFAVRRKFSARGYREVLSKLKSYAKGYIPLPELTGNEAPYSVPPTPATSLEYRGLPLDAIEDQLPKSLAYQQVVRQFLLPPPTAKEARPLTPLHAGHVGVLATAGLLNGVFNQGVDRHIARWSSTKNVTTTEEVEVDEESEKTTIIKRHTERFSNEVTVLYEIGKAKVYGEMAPMAEAEPVALAASA